MKKIQFESGTGRHFANGVNFLIGETEKYHIYAEVEVPEGASDDYGYITMRQAVLKAAPGLDAGFWYDGQEQNLNADANADCEVYTDIYEVKQ